LVKSKIEARDNALHLIVVPARGTNGIIYKSGFVKKQIICICKAFGRKFISYHKEEMYKMNSNIFSIDSITVVSKPHQMKRSIAT
jgi:hypothetical protein